MNGGVTIPDKDTARALNDLARHKAIVRILNDIRMDMEICEIEGWDKTEYLNLIRQLLNSIGGTKTMDNLISRQAAIDIERRATVDTNPEHFESHQKFAEFMDNAEISSFGSWQWSNGFNTALIAVGIDLKRLPSAQPEVIYCKDCKGWYSTDGKSGVCVMEHYEESGRYKTNVECRQDDYCSWAERREE